MEYFDIPRIGTCRIIGIKKDIYLGIYTPPYIADIMKDSRMMCEKRANLKVNTLIDMLF